MNDEKQKRESRGTEKQQTADKTFSISKYNIHIKSTTTFYPEQGQWRSFLAEKKSGRRRRRRTSDFVLIG